MAAEQERDEAMNSRILLRIIMLVGREELAQVALRMESVCPSTP